MPSIRERRLQRSSQRQPDPVAATQLVPTRRTLGANSIPGLAQGNGGGTFAAARVNRLTGDFINGSRSADQDLFSSNKLMRARGRELAVNSPFFVKFLQMMEQNVVGPEGILLQARIKNQYGKSTDATKAANLRIEAEWKRWCKRGRCTADGKFSLPQLQRMAIKNYGREGENLLKIVLGLDFNEAGIALQPIDNDQLDDAYNVPLQNNSSVRMGVEVNQYGRPQAYYLWSGHPNDLWGGQRERVRVPAAFIIHTFNAERPTQTRGYTPASSVMLEVKQLDGFDEATSVAARWAAAKLGVIQSQAADGFAGDDEDSNGSDTNSDGTNYSSGAPGEFLQLDEGDTLNFIDPRFPTNTYKDYTRTKIRRIATGLLVSYPTLGNDLENVNFSSIRAGLLDERDHWRILQRWFIDHFLQPIYDAWLKTARLTVLRDLVLTDDQWEQITWRARGWEWVDPVKDAAAAILRLQNGLSTYARELANMGLDFEEVMDERAAEQKFIENLKLVLGTDIRGVADAASDPNAGEPPANENEANEKPDAAAAKAPKPPGKPRSAAEGIVNRFLELHGS